LAGFVTVNAKSQRVDSSALFFVPKLFLYLP